MTDPDSRRRLTYYGREVRRPPSETPPSVPPQSSTKYAGYCQQQNLTFVIMPNTCQDTWTSQRNRRSESCRVRAVKPSAQPTLVRTQHLPLPREIAPDLLFSGLGLFLCRAAGCGSERPCAAGCVKYVSKLIMAFCAAWLGHGEDAPLGFVLLA